MQPVMACFSRGFMKEEHSAAEEWLTTQLKGARDQLCKKSDFCDQLADRLKELEADLKKRSSAEYEARELLNATNSELRAASRAREMQEAEVVEMRKLLTQDGAAPRDTDCIADFSGAVLKASLKSVEELSLWPTEQNGVEVGKDAMSTPTSPSSGEVTRLRQLLSDTGDADVAASPPKEKRHPIVAHDCAESERLQRLQVEVEQLYRKIRKAGSREAELQQQLKHERELHEEAVLFLSCHKKERVEQTSELQQELSALSNSLEQKEDDIFSIKFDMVELQNRLVDQARLVSENADAFQQASEELADKDERLSDALVKQEELLAQINSTSGQLQEKVERLSQELDLSRSAYQALEEQTRAGVKALESERDGLLSEVSRMRAEASESEARGRSEEARAEELAAKLAEVQKHVQSLVNVRLADGSAQALRAETQRTLDVQDQLVSANERLALAEVQLHDLSSALERAQIFERQAVERAQEYRTSLELYREFGKEDFMQNEMGFPVPRHEDSENSENPVHMISSVLVSVELDLGFTKAVLSIAPWQTRADFDVVVQDFLKEHKVRPVFADALVRYLEEVEANAVTFPTHASANLVDVHSRFS